MSSHLTIASTGWVAPLVGQDQRQFGMLAVSLAQSDELTRAESDRLSDLAQLAAVAVAHDAIRTELREQTRTHPITGLGNRIVLLERLRIARERAAGTGGGFAVIQIAVQGVRQVNEALGTAAGDELLRLVALRLVATAGASASVAHLWGADFAVLAEDLPALESGSALAVRLRTELRAPFDVEGLAVTVDASFGVSAYPTGSIIGGADDEPLRAAGAALDRIIRLASGEPGAIGESVVGPDNLAVAPELRRGLAEDELSVAYQPIIRLATGRVERYEALLRWTNPRLGLVPPDRFVRVAERTGLVAELGRFVLREAMAQLARLRRAGADVGVSVNVSVRQLADERLPELFAGLVAERQLPSGTVTLEVTEGVLLSGGAVGWRVLAGLREAGARIALDDFGTGFSQLAYLRQFRFDEIKIDRSFVADIVNDQAARAIIVGVVALADFGGMEVVAEGVEQADQRDLLADLGCTHGQGYLFGTPGPLD